MAGRGFVIFGRNSWKRLWVLENWALVECHSVAAVRVLPYGIAVGEGGAKRRSGWQVEPTVRGAAPSVTLTRATSPELRAGEERRLRVPS
jgi:hypothetical protein